MSCNGISGSFSWEFENFWSQVLQSASLFGTIVAALIAIALLGPGAAAMVFVSRRDDIE
jgi:hypothetical protein